VSIGPETAATRGPCALPHPAAAPFPAPVALRTVGGCGGRDVVVTCETPLAISRPLYVVITRATTLATNRLLATPVLLGTRAEPHSATLAERLLSNHEREAGPMVRIRPVDPVLHVSEGAA
jgi:hypothetical protein